MIAKNYIFSIMTGRGDELSVYLKASTINLSKIFNNEI
jgi:hypothetical protein